MAYVMCHKSCNNSTMILWKSALKIPPAILQTYLQMCVNDLLESFPRISPRISPETYENLNMFFFCFFLSKILPMHNLDTHGHQLANYGSLKNPETLWDIYRIFYQGSPIQISVKNISTNPAGKFNRIWVETLKNFYFLQSRQNKYLARKLTFRVKSGKSQVKDMPEFFHKHLQERSKLHMQVHAGELFMLKN